MKRKNNLYQEICKIENIISAFNEVCRNTNNFIFLGRNRKGKYAKYRNIKRKIKYRKRLYEDGKIDIKDIIEDMYFAKFLGIKTGYYHNTKVKDAKELSSACSGGGCEV